MREVFIKPIYGKSGKLMARMVCYVNRRKYQRHTAAQFDVMVDESDIRLWARSKNLVIVGEPKRKETEG